MRRDQHEIELELTPTGRRVYRQWYQRHYFIDAIYFLMRVRGSKFYLINNDTHAVTKLKNRNPLGLPPTPGGGGGHAA